MKLLLCGVFVFGHPSRYQGVNNRWNRWSENQSINRWQSMPINRLISIIDEQSMLEFYVIIDFIDYQFLSIINTNRSVNLHQLASIGCHFLCVLFSVKISKTRSLYASNNDENWDNTLIFSQRYNWYIVENMGTRFYSTVAEWQRITNIRQDN